MPGFILRPAKQQPVEVSGVTPTAPTSHAQITATFSAGFLAGPKLPLISDLLAEHRAAVAAVKASPELRGILGPEHDDLYILRYVLSNKGDADAAASAVLRSINWRREHADLLLRIDALQADVRATIATGMLPWRTVNGQPVQFTMPFAVPTEQWATKSEDWHFEAGISNRELAYRTCDRLTRESGRLHKLVMLQDATGLSLSFVLRAHKLAGNQGKLSKLSEFLYPQLIDKIIITHPPPFLSLLHRMAAVSMSERTLRKFKVAADAHEIAEVCATPRAHPPTKPSASHR